MSIKCGNSIKTFSDLQGLIYLFFLRKQLDDVFHKNDGGEKKSRKIKIMVSMKCVCCVLSRISRVQFCVTLQTVARQAAQSMGFSRQENWSELPCPPLGDLPNSRIDPRSPTLQVNSFLSKPPKKPKITIFNLY